ncbi:unnamed protein product [Brassica oleracea var. botrytis]|nr:unnamed protein product [Brassica napus]
MKAFMISKGESERTRALYERLLDRTKHYKVWRCGFGLQSVKLLLRNKKKTRKRKTNKK